MLINLIHDVDLLRYLVGEPTLVQAITSNQARGLEVEDTVALTLSFEGGAIGSFLATDAGASPWGWDQATTDSDDFPYVPNGLAYFLSGTRGALTVPTLISYSYPGEGEAEWRRPMTGQFLPRRAGNSYSIQLRHFVDVVERRSRSPWSPRRMRPDPWPSSRPPGRRPSGRRPSSSASSSRRQECAHDVSRRAHRRGDHRIPDARAAHGGGAAARARVRVPHPRPGRTPARRRRPRQAARPPARRGLRRRQRDASVQAAHDPRPRPV